MRRGSAKPGPSLAVNIGTAAGKGGALPPSERVANNLKFTATIQPTPERRRQLQRTPIIEDRHHRDPRSALLPARGVVAATGVFARTGHVHDDALATHAAVRVNAALDVAVGQQLEARVASHLRRIATADQVITDDIADLLVITDGAVLLLLQHGAYVVVLEVHTSCVVVCAGMSPAPGICIFMVTLIFITLPESDCADAAAASNANAHRLQMRAKDGRAWTCSGSA
jgi:hypothetical protein